MAENFGARLRGRGTGRGFAVVFGEFEGVREKKSVEARRGAGEAVTGVEAREAFFFGAEMELREQGAIFQGGGEGALAEGGGCLCDHANILLFFSLEAKRT